MYFRGLLYLLATQQKGYHLQQVLQSLIPRNYIVYNIYAGVPSKLYVAYAHTHPYCVTKVFTYIRSTTVVQQSVLV